MTVAAPARLSLSVLDRLIESDGATGASGRGAATIEAVLAAVRRDLEALLNARRPWRSPPERLAALRGSALTFGIADFAAGGLNDRQGREALRLDIEAAIRRFEPRLSDVEVAPIAEPSALSATLALRISALLHVDPEPEPISFDTIIDTTTHDVRLRPRDGRAP